MQQTAAFLHNLLSNLDHNLRKCHSSVDVVTLIVNMELIYILSGT